MINIDENFLLKYVLFVLTICDYNPLDKSILIFTVTRICHVICNILSFILVGLYVYYNIKNMRIELMSKVVEAIVTVLHVNRLLLMKV